MFSTLAKVTFSKSVGVVGKKMDRIGRQDQVQGSTDVMREIFLTFDLDLVILWAYLNIKVPNLDSFSLY